MCSLTHRITSPVDVQWLQGPEAGLWCYGISVSSATLLHQHPPIVPNNQKGAKQYECKTIYEKVTYSPVTQEFRF